MKIKRLIQATCIVCATTSGLVWSAEDPATIIKNIYLSKDNSNIVDAFEIARNLTEQILLLARDGKNGEQEYQVRLEQLGECIKSIEEEEKKLKQKHTIYKRLQSEPFDEDTVNEVKTILELYNHLNSKSIGSKKNFLGEYIWEGLNQKRIARSLRKLAWENLVDCHNMDLTQEQLQSILNEEEVIVNWSPESSSNGISLPKNYEVNLNLGNLQAYEIEQIEENNLKRLGEALEAALSNKNWEHTTKAQLQAMIGDLAYLDKLIADEISTRRELIFSKRVDEKRMKLVQSVRTLLEVYIRQSDTNITENYQNNEGNLAIIAKRKSKNLKEELEKYPRFEGRVEINEHEHIVINEVPRIQRVESPQTQLYTTSPRQQEVYSYTHGIKSEIHNDESPKEDESQRNNENDMISYLEGINEYLRQEQEYIENKNKEKQDQTQDEIRNLIEGTRLILNRSKPHEVKAFRSNMSIRKLSKELEDRLSESLNQLPLERIGQMEYLLIKMQK